MMTRKDIFKAVDRFLADDKRVISIRSLCELAGISEDTLRNVCQTKIYGMTPMVQTRLERAFEAIERGEVQVTRTHDQRVHVAYKRKATPEFKRGFQLTLKGGAIGIKTGLVNANCYRNKTFKEELED